MRSLAHLILLAACALPAALASPVSGPLLATRTVAVRSANPDPAALPHPLAARAPEPFLNAERLKRGLPPRRPRVRQASSGMGALRRDAQPSSVPCPKTTGLVQATESGGTTYYISASMNAFGEYEHTDNSDDALQVAYSQCATDPLDLQSLNGGSIGYLGTIVGAASSNNDLSQGSYNYVYLGDVTQTSSGSPAVSSPNSFTTATGISKGVESAVWNVASDGTLTISWVNTDGSVNSDLTIVRNQSDDFFMAVGDLSATEDEFGAIFSAVTLQIVPIPAGPFKR